MFLSNEESSIRSCTSLLVMSGDSFTESGVWQCVSLLAMNGDSFQCFFIPESGVWQCMSLLTMIEWLQLSVRGMCLSWNAVSDSECQSDCCRLSKSRKSASVIVSNCEQSG